MNISHIGLLKLWPPSSRAFRATLSDLSSTNTASSSRNPSLQDPFSVPNPLLSILSIGATLPHTLTLLSLILAIRPRTFLSPLDSIAPLLLLFVLSLFCPTFLSSSKHFQDILHNDLHVFFFFFLSFPIIYYF